MALLGFLVVAGPHPAVAAVSTEAVASAIQQRICFEYYWWGRDDVRLGKAANFSLRMEGGKAYAWSEDLSVVRGALRWARYFVLVPKGDRIVVGESYGFNLSYETRAPGAEQARMNVFGGQHETVEIGVPADCRPSPSGQAMPPERILANIERSMARSLGGFRETSGSRYPDRLDIVIARFTLDYPETLVLIPVTGEVFHVSLQDEADVPRGKAGGDDDYVIQPVYDKGWARKLSRKIVAHGIPRQIALPKSPR